MFYQSEHETRRTLYLKSVLLDFEIRPTVRNGIASVVLEWVLANQILLMQLRQGGPGDDEITVLAFFLKYRVAYFMFRCMTVTMPLLMVISEERHRRGNTLPTTRALRNDR